MVSKLRKLFYKYIYPGENVLSTSLAFWNELKLQRIISHNSFSLHIVLVSITFLATVFMVWGNITMISCQPCKMCVSTVVPPSPSQKNGRVINSVQKCLSLEYKEIWANFQSMWASDCWMPEVCVIYSILKFHGKIELVSFFKFLFLS